MSAARPFEPRAIDGENTIVDADLWKKLKASPVVLELVAQGEAERLARRRELQRVINEYAEEADNQERILIPAHQAATKRREKAEEEFHSSLVAESAAFAAMSAVSGTFRRQVYPLEKELESLCDPRIEKTHDWLISEFEFNTKIMPPMEFSADLRVGGFDQVIRRELIARTDKLRDGIGAVRAMRKELIEPNDLLPRLRKIYATIPPIPVGSSMPHRQGRRDVPDFLVNK